MDFDSRLLLVTNRQDTTTDLLVVAAAAKRVPLVRVNTEDLAEFRASYAANTECFRLSHLGQTIELKAGIGVCYRRPAPPNDLSHDPSTYQWITEQWRDFIEGLEVLEGVKWLSRPSAVRLAENKIVQLSLARKAGFAVPPTLVTNDIQAYTELRRGEHRLVAKSLAGGLIGPEDCGHFVYTTEIDDSNQPSSAELQLAPVVFQRCLSPAVHYRVTVVGDRIFAVRLRVSDELIDWRLSDTAPNIETTRLPDEAEKSARDLVASAGLAFSTMDLIECGGTIFFVDLNPNGEWAWLQHGTGIPIASAIVDYLTDHG